MQEEVRRAEELEGLPGTTAEVEDFLRAREVFERRNGEERGQKVEPGNEDV